MLTKICGNPKKLCTVKPHSNYCFYLEKYPLERYSLFKGKTNKILNESRTWKLKGNRRYPSNSKRSRNDSTSVLLFWPLYRTTRKNCIISSNQVSNHFLQPRKEINAVICLTFLNPGESTGIFNVLEEKNNS